MTRPGREFEMRIELSAERAAVWKALTDAREIARWFAPTVVSENRVGGALVWQWGPHHTWRLTIVEMEPGAHLRARYDSAVDDGEGGKRPLFIDFFVAGSGGTTTLRVVQSGFGPESGFDQEYDGISAGWPVELRSLRLYVERHFGKERALAWSAVSTPARPADAWARLGRHLAVTALPVLAEGAPFVLDVPGAGHLEGTTLFAPSAREFSGVVENLDGGWFRVHCEAWGGATQVWLWLAIYGEHVGVVERYDRAFARILDDVGRAGATEAAR